MIPCDRAWQWGETQMPGWVHDEMYMAIAGVGLIMAILQVASGFRKGFKSMAHKGVQLVAAGDVIICLWWLVVARHTVGDADSWYKKHGTCKLLETVRTATEVCGVFWTMMLSVLIAIDAHYFYQFEAVPRELLRSFGGVFFVTPLVQVILVVWWKVKTPCPSEESSKTEEAAEHVLTILYLLMLATTIAAVSYAFYSFRSKRTGVVPRLLFLPISVVFRGIAPLLTCYGWFGQSCTHDWAGVWSIVSPALPIFHCIVYFARPLTVAVLSKTPPPTPIQTDDEQCHAGSDRTSLLDLPLRIQQVHLDFLWGCSSQALLFERKVRKGIHRGRSSAGSSYINSDPYGSEAGEENEEQAYLTLHPPPH